MAQIGPREDVTRNARLQMEGEVTRLRELVTAQQAALLRQQQALSQATEALDHVRADGQQALAQVKEAAEQAINGVAARLSEEAKAAALEQVQVKLRAEREETDSLVREVLAHEREKHAARFAKLESAEQRLGLLEDAQVRGKLLELAVQEKAQNAETPRSIAREPAPGSGFFAPQVQVARPAILAQRVPPPLALPVAARARSRSPPRHERYDPRPPLSPDDDDGTPRGRRKLKAAEAYGRRAAPRRPEPKRRPPGRIAQAANHVLNREPGRKYAVRESPRR